MVALIQLKNVLIKKEKEKVIKIKVHILVHARVKVMNSTVESQRSVSYV